MSLMGAHPNILGNEVKIALASVNIKMINPAKWSSLPKK